MDACGIVALYVLSSAVPPGPKLTWTSKYMASAKVDPIFSISSFCSCSTFSTLCPISFSCLYSVFQEVHPIP